MAKEKVIIIIPVFNEEENIATTLKAILTDTESLQNFKVEILIFDSQSTDNTASIVRTFTQKGRVHFVKEPQKSGLGSAYLQAMRYAIENLAADIIFEFDADGSHQPKYITPMLQLLEKYDVVVGSRYIAGGGVPHDWSFYRKFLSMFGNWIARLFLTNQYKDLTSGFRATRTTVLKKILPEKFLSPDYAYKLHLYFLLIQAHAKIVEFPIVFLERKKGNSKLPKNSIADTLRVLFILRFCL